MPHATVCPLVTAGVRPPPSRMGRRWPGAGSSSSPWRRGPWRSLPGMPGPTASGCTSSAASTRSTAGPPGDSVSFTGKTLHSFKVLRLVGQVGVPAQPLRRPARAAFRRFFWDLVFFCPPLFCYNRCADRQARGCHSPPPPSSVYPTPHCGLKGAHHTPRTQNLFPASGIRFRVSGSCVPSPDPLGQ